MPLNLGFNEEFVVLWLRSWGIGFVLIAPVMLLAGKNRSIALSTEPADMQRRIKTTKSPPELQAINACAPPAPSDQAR
ncbi:DUF2798 domain-containing protein [Cupriavidus necator]|uniref:DUF2798 domain-containing protein n=1 Tax=Cupriavidus necator TaxID=106590 RepID=UPI0012FF941D|nr:DUF2798 domain-containing protein [Cupriavidus necator]QQB76431.1 DUF2798 domain-containing protein [Cupriavidus necator]WKA42628.1 DUF2798 domain-containing protein [Cupriavidus necator]